MTVSLPSRDEFSEYSSEVFDQLTPIERAFVLQYVLGDEGIRGVQYRSYQLAAGKDVSKDVAGVCASKMIRRPEVREALRELRRSVELVVEDRMIPMANLALKGQIYIEQVLETATNPDLPNEKKVFANPNTMKAIEMVWERAWGKPKQVQEHEIGQKLEDMLKQIAEKKRDQLMAPRQQLESLPIRIIESGDDK